MPKLKPRKGILKRIKVTATGKLMRHRAGKRHLMSTKSGKRRRALRRPASISKSNINKMKKMLGI